VTYVGLGLSGIYYVSSEGVYIAIFALIGFVQSICFPAFVGISGAWFSRKNRGVAVNGFCICQNMGNIVGAQLGAFLLRQFDKHWGWLFILCAAWFVVLVVLQIFFLKPEPAQMGIYIEDSDKPASMRPRDSNEEEHFNSAGTPLVA